MAAAGPGTGPGTITVKVIGFNDFHGNLESPGKLAAGPGEPEEAVGGVDYLAAYVARLARLNPNHLVVSAGDLAGASPLISAFYHDEATVEAMNLLGLDYSAVGNHEFDAGPAELMRKQRGGCLPSGVNTCLGGRRFAGATFQYLAANVTHTANGKTIFPPYAIKTFQGVRVGIIGVGLKGTPAIVSPKGLAGLVFGDEADAVNALIPELHAMGVHAIVVLIHQGGIQTPLLGSGASRLDGCEGLAGNSRDSPIVAIVSRLSDAVDVVVSGHTHAAYNCRLANRAGRAIPVTQAGALGGVITDIDLTIDRASGRVIKVSASNILVSRARADSAASPVHAFLDAPAVQKIRGIVAAYKSAAAPLADRVVGTIAGPLSNIPLASGEQAAADLIVDSLLAATAAPGPGGALIALLNHGGVRDPGFESPNAKYPHEVTYQEIFTVRPFGNSLVTMTLSARDIKDVLEQQFTGCKGQTSDSMLQVSRGFHVEWSASAAPCAKVVNVSLDAPGDGGRTDRIVADGVVQHPGKTYRVTVDDFLAAGKDNFTGFFNGTHLVGGPQDIDAIVAYLSSKYRAPNPPYDPTQSTLDFPRIVRLP